MSLCKPNVEVLFKNIHKVERSEVTKSAFLFQESYKIISVPKSCGKLSKKYAQLLGVV